MNRIPLDRMTTAFLIAVVMVLSVSGCDLLNPTVCHTGISYDVDPPAAELVVGESFTPTAMIESCPKGKRPIDMAWSSRDPSIASVEPESGRVTGLTEGQTVIEGSYEGSPALVTVLVTVRGAPSHGPGVP